MALMELLSSSTPNGVLPEEFSDNTPGSLETQAEVSNWTQHNVVPDADISHEIDDLISYVDNFSFLSPPQTTTVSRDNQRVPSAYQLNMTPRPNLSVPAPRSAPARSRAPFLDRTNEPGVEMEVDGAKFDLIQKRLKEDKQPTPDHIHIREYDNNWDTFKTLVSETELALSEAWRERDEACAWAKEVRETTQNWVEEQRQQIERERNALQEDPTYGQKITTVNEIEYEARVVRLERTLRGIEKYLNSHFIQNQEASPRMFAESHGNVEERPKKKIGEEEPWPIRFRSDSRVLSRKSAESSRVPPSSSFETPQPRFDMKRKYCIGTTPGSVGLRRGHSHSPSHTTNCCSAHQTPNAASTIRFPNGDIQITSDSLANSGSVYYHAKSRVVRVKNSDGSETFEFPNKQVERRYLDGRKIVRFPDGTKKRYYPKTNFTS